MLSKTAEETPERSLRHSFVQTLHLLQEILSG